MGDNYEDCMRQSLFCKSLIAGILSLQVILIPSAQAQDTTAAMPPEQSPTNLPQPIELDLTSSLRSLSPGKFAGDQSISIQVGDQTKVITADVLLTPGERLAAYQVFSTGAQSIVLAETGNAIGGSFTMGPRFSTFVSGVVIPESVTATRDFGQAGSLNLVSNLVNAGTIMATSTNPEIMNGTINASSFINSATGVVSGMLSNANTASLARFDLNINTSGDIVNQGIISTTGNLNLISGSGVINNSGLISSAMGNVNLAGINQVVVSQTTGGIIEALQGSVNISNLGATQLASTQLAGQLGSSAILSSITQSLPALGGVTLSGGQFLSQMLNINAGTGDIAAEVVKISGILTTEGNYAHVGVSDGCLTLGKTNINGDPTYFNSAINGDITISGDISVNENLAIIASRNITTTAGATLIQARSVGGQGFDIQLVAGANIIGGVGSTAVIAQTPPVVGNAIAPVTVSGASSSGGSIDFSASPNIVINANSTCADCDGANITMVAFANGASGGNIILPGPNSSAGSVVDSSGSGAGNNGNITLIAGATSGTSIQTGRLIASGGTGTDAGTGVVSLTTAQPTTSDGNSITFGPLGNVTSGNVFVPSAPLQLASINITNNVSASNQVNVLAGGSITASHNILATIPVAPSPTLFFLGTPFHELGQGTTVNHAGTYAYVANLLGNSVSVIRISDNTVVDTIAIDPPTPAGNDNPIGVLEGIAVTPDDQYVLVCSIYGDTYAGDGYIAIIRTSDNTIVNKVRSPVYPFPTPNPFPAAVTIDAAGQYAYVSNEGFFPDPTIPVPAFSTISVVDLGVATAGLPNAIINQVQLNFDPFESIIHPGGRYMYALNAYTDGVTPASIAVVDLDQAKDGNPSAVIKTIPITTDPNTLLLSVAMNPNGKEFYMSSAFQNSVFVFDSSNPADPFIKTTFAVGPEPSGLSIDPAGTFLYVANASLSTITPSGTPNPVFAPPSGSVSIVRTADHTIVETLATGVTPIVFSNQFVGYSADNSLVGYLRNEGDFNHDNLFGNTVSAFQQASISAPVVNFNARNGSISGGVNAAALSVNAGGNVALSSNTNTTINSSGAGNVFQFGTTGTVTLASAISAPIVSIYGSTVIGPPATAVVPTTPAFTAPQFRTATSAVISSIPIVRTNLPSAISTTILPTDATPFSAGLPSPPAEVSLKGSISDAQEKDVLICFDSEFTPSSLVKLQGLANVLSPSSGLTEIFMTEGSALFSPSKDITVRSELGTVKIAGGSIALIVLRANDMTVMDLHDGGHNDVAVELAQQRTSLRPGQELFISREIDASFAQSGPSAGLGFRSVEELPISEHKGFIADFPIIRALQSGALGAKLRNQDSPKVQQLVRKALKSAACVQMISANRGRYETGAAP